MKTSVVRWAVLACVLVFALTGGSVWAEDEVLPVAANAPGFKAESSYQNLGNGESVNAFNGGLIVTHPSSIGLPENMGRELRPVRTYNSLNAFAGFSDLAGVGDLDRPIGPLGVGWHIGVGRVFTRIILEEYVYFYKDESGAEHRFFDVYHDLPEHTKWFTTDDGSYIRARLVRDLLNGNTGEWTLYFPDGSVRVAGDPTKNAYVAAVVPDPGPNEPHEVTNPFSNGWYVTAITDRAGNSTSIMYRPFNPNLPPLTSGFAGAIAFIQDPFGRVIYFQYDPPQTVPGASSLIWKIQLLDCHNPNVPFDPNTSTSTVVREEEYFYSTKLGTVGSGWENWPVLEEVQDAEDLATHYTYYNGGTGFPPNPNAIITAPLLKSIFYPTGGRSTYGYGRGVIRILMDANRQYHASGTDITNFQVLTHTLEFKSDPGQADQKLTWTWKRAQTRYALLTGLGYGNMPILMVLTRDPLGKEEVRYFATQEWTNQNNPPPAVPPGTELLRTVRKPGAPPLEFSDIANLYNCQYPNCPPVSYHYNVWEQVISWERKEYEFGGGDVDFCRLNFGTVTRPIDPHGNMRPKRVVQAEIAPDQVQTNFTCGIGTCQNGTTNAKWVKEVQAFDWNGFGNFEQVETRDLSANADPTVKYVKNLYDAPPRNPWLSAQVPYMTDQLIYSSSGSSAMYRAVSYTRDAATGLVTGQRWYVNPQSTLITATSASNDKLLEILYTTGSGNKGNIQKLTYSGGDNQRTYKFRFTWTAGQVSHMSRGEDDNPVTVFDRSIDPITSLIQNDTDPNGLTTVFDYDDLNRLILITPPHLPTQENYSTYIAYPKDATNVGEITWTTSHDILFYRGPQKDFPTSVTLSAENAWLADIDSGAAYQHYLFDDMGRPEKTRSLHPDGYLTETMTAYDPLGRSFFTSLPYQAINPPSPGTLDWGAVGVEKLKTAGDHYVSSLPLNPAAGAQYQPYGSATSTFADATWPTTQGALASLIAGPREAYDRTVWSFKPDGSKTKNTYDGLNQSVTLFGIKTGATIDPEAPSTTTYKTDIWRRRTLVQPPVGSGGTTAAYTYNGLDQLTDVNLSGQHRTFTYDALGRILTANNPENGMTHYLGYDCIGNPLAAQDANGAAASEPYKLVHTYDLLGRLTATAKVRVSDSAILLTLLENTYDSLPEYELGPSVGKLVQSISRQDLADSTRVTTGERLAYQSGTGRVESLSQFTDAGGGEENTLSMAYDAYGQVTDQTLPDGTVLSNAYGHGAILQRMVNGNPVLAALQYDMTGTLTKVLFDTGESQEIALDAFKRPKGFAFLDDQGVPLWGNGSYQNASEPYKYDGAGNIVSIGTSATDKDTFTYDVLSRLKTADVHRATGLHRFAYEYDKYGNLLSRNETVPTGLPYADLKSYLTGQLNLGETEAEDYIREAVFSADIQGTSNKLGLVTRGANTGLETPSSATMIYDANGNLVDDGKFLYVYDALNRQVSVTDPSTNLVVAEYVYLPSGERVATLKYQGTVLADYVRYFRDGAAVIWEKADSMGHGKSYVYAGGHMAYTHEAWRRCVWPQNVPASSATLGTPTVTALAGSETATVEFELPALPAEAEAIEVRLVKGNTLVSAQRILRPLGGWCGQERMTFAGLPEGGDYQAGLTLFAREGRAKKMPPRGYLVERMRLGLVRGRMSAWTVARLDEQNSSIREEAASGVASLAPPGTEDYGAKVQRGDTPEKVARGPQAQEVALPESTSSAAVKGASGSAVPPASPTMGLTKGGGGFPKPICTDYSIRTYFGVDHLGTVRYTKTYSYGENLWVYETTHDYEPFGVELPGKDLCGNTHQYTGHERDQETGNDYMHFRYFGNSMGRFMKPDSVFQGAAVNPQGFNLYSYVAGNPVNLTDPTGHWLTMYSYDIVTNPFSHETFYSNPFGNSGGGGGSTITYTVWSITYYANGTTLYTEQTFTIFEGQEAPQDYAMLSQASYNPGKTALPPNWEMVGKPYSNKISGLQAVVYHNTVTGEYVLAFPGVVNARDVWTSLRQMFTGSSRQFSEAKGITEEAKRKYGSNLTLLGHSLGGGLAAAMAVEYDLHAVTFNAEGVNARTVGGSEILAKGNDLVTNYYTGGDWLTGIQMLTPLPNAVGVQVYSGPGGHGISNFIAGP